LELVLAAQELSEFGDPDLSPTELDEEEGYGAEHNCADIWQDTECLRLIREGTLSDAVDYHECRRIRKKASTKFSPFMILTGRTPRLRADNYLQALTTETNDGDDIEETAAQFLQKMELIGSIHNSVLCTVEQAQKQQKKVYAAPRGKHLFEGLIVGQTMVKMKKPGKRRALSASWEGPYQFTGHTDGKRNLDFEEGSRLCIIQDGEGHQWERSRRDLQIFYIPPHQMELRDLAV